MVISVQVSMERGRKEELGKRTTVYLAMEDSLVKRPRNVLLSM